MKNINFFLNHIPGGSQTKALSLHLDYTISQQGLFFLGRKEEKGNRSSKYKKRWLVAKNLADAFFSGLLSTFFSLQCGTRGSNEESGVESLMINYFTCQSCNTTIF